MHEIKTQQKFLKIKTAKISVKLVFYSIESTKYSSFYWPFSRWTWVTWYILDSIGARDHGGGSDNWGYKTCKAPPKLSPSNNNKLSQQTNTQFFTGWMAFLSPNQQCQSTEGIKHQMLQANQKWQYYLVYTVSNSSVISLNASINVLESLVVLLSGKTERDRRLEMLRVCATVYVYAQTNVYQRCIPQQPPSYAEWGHQSGHRCR